MPCPPPYQPTSQLTAAEYNVGAKVLVLNNNFQGMVKQWQDLFYDERYCATKMFNPCYSAVAQACGIKGLRCAGTMSLVLPFSSYRRLFFFFFGVQDRGFGFERSHCSGFASNVLCSHLSMAS